MMREELFGLPVAVDLKTAAKALGIGRTKAYLLAKRGALPVPVWRLGHSYRVTRKELLTYLGAHDVSAFLERRDNPPAAPAQLDGQMTMEDCLGEDAA